MEGNYVDRIIEEEGLEREKQAQERWNAGEEDSEMVEINILDKYDSLSTGRRRSSRWMRSEA